MKILFSKNFPKENQYTIDKIVNRALEELKISDKICIVNFVVSKKLKDNVDVDYKKLKQGKIKIIIGSYLSRKINKNLIYHELGHVYDKIYNDIETFKRIKKKPKLFRDLVGEVINISLDGRLEKMGLAHIPKNVRINLSINYLDKKYKKKIKKKDLIKLYKEIWGKKFTSFKEIMYWSKKYYRLSS